MDLDGSGWSGDGDFTRLLIEALKRLPVRFVKVEDAPASRADSMFSFISNELFVAFDSAPRDVRARILGVIPVARVIDEKLMSLATLEVALTAMPDIGPPDYTDDGMLQYLRTERVIPPYQTRGYKLVELVRIYEAGVAPDRRTTREDVTD
jgi:hypothetical protein